MKENMLSDTSIYKRIHKALNQAKEEIRCAWLDGVSLC